VFGKLFARFSTRRDVDTLIKDIADHQRPEDYSEFLRLLPRLRLYLPLVGPLPPGLPSGERFQVGADMQLHTRTASIGGQELALAFTSRAHPDLGSEYAEMEGAEALRMTLRVPGIEGLLVQSTGTGWVGLDKEKISFVLSGRA